MHANIQCKSKLTIMFTHKRSTCGWESCQAIHGKTK